MDCLGFFLLPKTRFSFSTLPGIGLHSPMAIFWLKRFLYSFPGLVGKPRNKQTHKEW